MADGIKQRKSSSQKCFDLYFKQAFISWAHLAHPNLSMGDVELVNCGKKMWDDMCNEMKNKGCIKDGDKELRFSITSSVSKEARTSDVSWRKKNK